MKRNPRKVRWTKAYRALHGKDLTGVRALPLNDGLQGCSMLCLLRNAWRLVLLRAPARVHAALRVVEP
jgi:hypothetical protein